MENKGIKKDDDETLEWRPANVLKINKRWREIMSEYKSIFDERTLYTINDEYGNRTTLTLDKFTADVLQQCLPDVHTWVESEYGHVVGKKPDLTRREKGDVVRLEAQREAEKYPYYQAKLVEVLGA